MRYWLLEWLEKNNINTEQDLFLLNFDKKTIKSMYKEAEEWSFQWKVTNNDLDCLFAGTGLSPADQFCCPAYNCIINVIDTLFRHAWHYFDKITIKDFAGAALLNIIEPPTNDKEYYKSLVEHLVSAIRIVIFLKNIGGIDLIDFIPYINPSDEIIKDAFEKDSETIKASAKIMSEVLLSKAEFSFKTSGNMTYVEMNGSPLGITMGRDFKVSPRTSVEKIKRLYLEDLYDLIFQSHYADCFFIKEFNASLGSTFWPTEVILNNIRQKQTSIPTPLHLEIPSLSKIPLKELIRLRNSEKDSFIKFKTALKKAFALNANEVEEKFTKQIVNDIVKPELSNLSLKLKTAQSSLKRKTIVTIGLGAIGTTCGILLGASDVVAGMAGIAPMLTASAGAGSKYLDDLRELKSSDMYFLWEALKHAE